MRCMFRLLFLLLIGVLLAGCAEAAPTATPSPVPTSTATFTPTPRPTGTPTITPLPTVVVQVTQLSGQGTAPPLTIDLPPGWGFHHDVLTIPDVDALRPIQVSIYQGPITGGTGTIVLLWGFPNILGANPFTTPNPEPNLWSDGLRLFRLTLVDRGCVPGTDLQRDFTIGDLPATGTLFAIVDCPESPDTRGWFAGLQRAGINFVFYTYAEPITAMDDGAEELQAILDTVRFTIE